jgi:hypothetical protein
MRIFFGSFMLILGLFIQKQVLSSLNIIEDYGEDHREIHLSQGSAKILPTRPFLTAGAPQKHLLPAQDCNNYPLPCLSSSSNHSPSDNKEDVYKHQEDQNKASTFSQKDRKRKYYEEGSKHQPYWSFSKNVQVSALLSFFIYTTSYTILDYNGIESFYYGCLFFPVFYNIFRLTWI